MDFLINILELFGIYAIVTIGLNYQIGNVGIMYLGQIAYFAIGAYASGVCPVILKAAPIPSMIIGVLISLSLAYASGKIFVRLSGHYLLIASLGITEIVRSLINNSVVTGGAQGITITGNFFGQNFFAAKHEMVFLVFACLLLEIWFFASLKNSPKGRLFAALKEDETLVRIMGNDPIKLKIQAMMITAAWSSVAGSLFAHYSLYIDPTSFTINESLLLYIGILIGGLASLKGSFFAAFVLIIIPVVLRFVQLPGSIVSAAHQLFFAFLILFILKFYPNGLFSNNYGTHTK